MNIAIKSRFADLSNHLNPPAYVCCRIQATYVECIELFKLKGANDLASYCN